MTALGAIEQAIYVHDKHKHFDRQTRMDSAVALGEWGVFSNRQIATLTGLLPAEVGALTRKTDRTGGRLTPESLPLILKVARAQANGEVENAALIDAVKAGTSLAMIGRLTGIPNRTLSHRYSKALAPAYEGSAAA